MLSGEIALKNNHYYYYEYSETLESSAINDGRYTLAIFLTVLYKVED